MTDAQSTRIDAIFTQLTYHIPCLTTLVMAKTAIRLEHEWSDKPDYGSVKIVDPDGYVVEIAFDASLYGVIAYESIGRTGSQRSHRIDPL